ncbi:MAG: CoA transferase [bacterium]|nr:CoA transferase [bacterium]
MLSHLRVLDLTDGGASVAGRILSDLGAEVVLVEPPGGAASRGLGPFAGDTPDPERSLEFWATHRGKASVEIDLASEAGRDRLTDLAAAADVWIDDRSFPDLRVAGFAPEALRKRHPRLVVATVSPFGETGPKRDWAATDLTVTAASHAMWMTGDADRAPLTCSVPQAFLHAGGDAASGILIALAEREGSGRGQHVDVSAQISMMQSGQSGVLAHGWRGTQMSRSGGGVAVAGYRLRFIYPCKDGYVNLTLLFGVPIGYSTQRFFDWMDEEGMSNDVLRAEDWVAYGAKFLGGHTTVEAHEAVMEAIERFTRTKTKAELFAAAFERRLLIVPLSNVQDLVESEQLAARDFWRTVEQPGADRPVRLPGPFARFSETPLTIDRPAPALGGWNGAWTPTEPSESIGDGARRPPLEGLKVLDFTWVYAGPAITRLLADFGATVIKVEASSAPDALRSNGPYVDDVPGPENTANFSNVNLGKQSIGLNLKTPEGIDVAKRLIDWADVVVENFSPKAMEGFGLDWARLRERRPDLVMLSSSLCGGTGPQRLLAGYGTMGSALAGFGFVTGWPDRNPSAPFMAYTDYVSPRFATPAILAALEHRKRTGLGQHIDLSQAECSMHFLGSAILDYTVNGRILEARGNASPHHAPSGVYAADGDERWLAIAAPDDDAWQALAKIAGRSWESDPRFATPEARLEHRAALDQEIESWTRDRDLGEVETALQSEGVPAHRVIDSPGAFADPQLAAREHFVPIEYGSHGLLPYEAPRMHLSATPGVLSPCPGLGEHNQSILGEILGLDDDAITELVIAGAIE